MLDKNSAGSWSLSGIYFPRILQRVVRVVFTRHFYVLNKGILL